MYSIINCRQGGTVVETGVTNYRNQRDLPKSPKKTYRNHRELQKSTTTTTTTKNPTYRNYRHILFTGCKNITFITLINIFMIRGITKTF